MRMILACTRDFGIGLGGKLPWHNTSDLRYFKRKTMGCDLLVGHNTWLGLPTLEGRNVVILPRRYDPSEYVRRYPNGWIIGGARTYDAFVELCDEIHCTYIEGTYKWDTALTTKTIANMLSREFVMDDVAHVYGKLSGAK